MAHLSNSPTSITTDADVLRRQNRLVRSKEEDEKNDSWEIRYAKRAYDKLIKNRLLLDFSRLADGGMIGARWRTPQEAQAGLADTECGTVGCGARRDLQTLEFPFGFIEGGDAKSILAETRLCLSCGALLRSGWQYGPQGPRPPASHLDVVAPLSGSGSVPLPLAEVGNPKDRCTAVGVEYGEGCAVHEAAAGTRSKHSSALSHDGGPSGSHKYM